MAMQAATWVIMVFRNNDTGPQQPPCQTSMTDAMKWRACARKARIHLGCTR